MASRVSFVIAGGIFVLCAILFASHRDVSADQRLQNGGFEAATANWAGNGLSVSGCTPRSGSGALNLSTSPASQTVFAQQTIAGPFGAGNHALSGFYKVASGAPSITIGYTWRTSSGDQPPRSQALTSTAAYTSLALNDANPPANATALVVKLTVSSSATSTVCFDDLSLDAPPPPPPTPLPTQTPIPTLVPTATATATQAATSTVVVSGAISTPTSPPANNVATSTSTAISATAVSAAATSTVPPGSTSTPIPTETAATFSGSSQLFNGNFEQGISGWQHYAGDLGAVGNPVHGGSGAGQLSSASTATKWAYQIVSIDPTKAYEFNGYVRPASNVKSAYLRISWYEAADASGVTISTDDSSKITGGSDYAFLTTGGIAPPTTAHSARLKVMLGPQDAGTAIMFMDDFSFSQTSVAAAKAASKVSAPDDPIEAPASSPTAISTPRPADATSTAAAVAQATSPAAGATTPEAATTPETPKEATASAKAAKTSTASAAKSASGVKATSTPKRSLTAEVAGARTDKTPEAQGGADKRVDEPSEYLSPDPDRRSKLATVALGVLAMFAAGGGAHYFSKRQAN